MEDPPRFLSSFFCVFMKGKSNRKSGPSEGNQKQTISKNPAALPQETHRQFSLNQIRAATCNFRRDLIIGHGAFGTVYKGFFDDGNLVVAVKRLKLGPERGAGYEEFRTELLMLCQLNHQNLVRCLGFCFDKGEMILVYEFMGKGKLSDRLYGSRYDPLPWKLRLEICIGAARGLHYLHTGAKRVIIHGNVNSGDILLDGNWVCKLSDFRASRLLPRSNSKFKTSERIDTLAQGNYGYLDPEYLETGQLEEKCDVYSFGVVLFEVFCARRPFVVHDDGEKSFLVDLACQSVREGTVYDIIDPYLKGRIAPECLEMLVDIAGSCTSVVGDERPEMGEVEVMLERALELQEKADSDPTHMAPCGEYRYDEATFCAFVPPHKSRVDGNSSDGESVSGLTYPTMDSGDIQSIASDELRELSRVLLFILQMGIVVQKNPVLITWFFLIYSVMLSVKRSAWAFIPSKSRVATATTTKNCMQLQKSKLMTDSPIFT